MSSGLSGWSTNTRVRESSAPITSKLGFSVVAPIRVMVPSSAGGSRLSCCALFSRWISSTKRIVCSPPGLEPFARLGHDFPDARHALGYRTERHEDPRGGGGDQMRERRLPAARRAPEDHRAGGAALDGIAQRLPRPQQVLLAHELVQRRRPHARRQRPSLPAGAEERALPGRSVSAASTSTTLPAATP